MIIEGGFSYAPIVVEILEWISLIVIVPKKNKKLRICVDYCYHKLNATTMSDPFPLLYMDSILDEVAGQEIYSFLYEFNNGYNQIWMEPKG